MDVTPLISSDRMVIQGYKGGTFSVSGKKYSNSIVVYPEIVTEWAPASFEDINFNSFSELIDSNVEIVLLGTGERLKRLDLDLHQQLRDAGLSVDVMDTGAACRTYNILMAEGRLVAAALFLT